MRCRHVAVFLSIFAPLSGCQVDVMVPAVLSVAAAPMDLDVGIDALEAAVCSELASADCGVLKALDRFDGVAATPSALPQLMPRTIDVEALPESVDVQNWFGDQQPQGSKLLPAPLVQLVVPEGLGAEDIVDIEIDAASVTLRRSTLTVDVPRFDLYVGNGVTTDEDGVTSGIADGEFVAVTDSADGGPVYFAEGGVAALLAALGGEEPWAQLRPQSVVSLRVADSALLHRPGGHADVSLDLQLRVPVRFGLKPYIETP